MSERKKEGKNRLPDYAGYVARLRYGDGNMALMSALDALRKSAEVINNGNLTLRVNEMMVFVQNNEGKNVLPTIIKRAVEEISQTRRDGNCQYPVGEPRFPW